MTNIKNFNAIVGIPTRKGIEECLKSFIKPKILGCNENEEVLPNL